MESFIYYNAIARSYEKLYRDEQIQKALFIKRVLEAYGVKLALDVGAGTGILEEVCSDIIFDVVEPSHSMLNILKRKKLKNIRKIYDSKIEEAKIKEKYNAVIALTVLQDVSDRKEFIEKLFSLANKNGLVIISYLSRANIVMSQYTNRVPTITEKVANDIINVFLNI
jgi:2-polyprenyl-3-methyl-5-hydroxy-6-metoxy-1,4-benzoquinol methylase